MLKDLLIGYGKGKEKEIEEIKTPSFTEQVKAKKRVKRGTSTHELRTLDWTEWLRKEIESKFCTFVVFSVIVSRNSISC